MVVTASLEVDINLEKLLKKLENVEYEPNQFPGMVVRIDKPKSACLIFTSGRIVCTGTKKMKDAKIVIAKLVTKLRKIGIKIPSGYKLKLQNTVASAKLKMNLNLDKIGFILDNTEYEPEQFPGLVYRMYDPKVTFLLFTSGSVVCTGAKSVADIKKAVEKLDKELRILYKTKIKNDII